MLILPPPPILAQTALDRAPLEPGVPSIAETNAGGDAADPGTDHPMLARDRAQEAARRLRTPQDGPSDGLSDGPQYGPEDDAPGIPGFPPLDTRDVGDRDIIDPDRPVVRGPDPLQGSEDRVDPPNPKIGLPATDPPLEPVPQAKTEEPTDTPDPADHPPPKMQSEPEDDATRPTKQAQPASPGASAPDIPEPPLPGAVDIRR